MLPPVHGGLAAGEPSCGALRVRPSSNAGLQDVRSLPREEQSSRFAPPNAPPVRHTGQGRVHRVSGRSPSMASGSLRDSGKREHGPSSALAVMRERLAAGPTGPPIQELLSRSANSRKVEAGSDRLDHACCDGDPRSHRLIQQARRRIHLLCCVLNRRHPTLTQYQPSFTRSLLSVATRQSPPFGATPPIPRSPLASYQTGSPETLRGRWLSAPSPGAHMMSQ